MHRTRRPNGFTLIELLVVIAIIAILAAMLMPVFLTARSKARQVACVSNMSQISKAALMYCDDNEGAFPTHCSWYMEGATDDYRRNVAGTTGVCYHDLLMPYVKNERVFICPERPKATGCCGVTAGSTRAEVKSTAGITSYATKVNFYGELNLNRLKKPSYYGYLFEAVYDFIDTPELQLQVQQSPDDTQHRLMPWHQGRMNVAFADGHVTTYDRDDPYNDRSFWSTTGE